MSPISSIVLVVLALLHPANSTGQTALPDSPVAAAPAPSAIDFTHVRALWITRYDYKTRADVERAIAGAAGLGITDVIWQVRGQADAFYASAFEPWGEELCTPGPAGEPIPPDFDPLATAIEAAHARGLRLHAWLNVMPLWKGKVPPRFATHPYLALPGLRLRDLAGEEQPLNDHYVIVNPANEDTHTYLAAVVSDLASKYAIDGLHLDYIRFVSDTMDKSKVYPGDPATLAAFERATGSPFARTPEGVMAYRAWLGTRITALVGAIADALHSARPAVPLTAAVWRHPDLARDTYLQDAPAWLHAGTLQHAFPMIYTVNDDQFRSDLDAWTAAAPAGTISPGLGTYLHPADQSPRQLDYARARGIASTALFAYNALFDSADPNQLKTPAARAERAARLVALAAYLKAHQTP